MKKKRKIVVIAASVCFCIAAAASSLFTGDIDQTADIPEHDGEVLVDSLNVSEPQEGRQESKPSKDTELVASDNISDMKQADTYFQEMRATINLDRNQMISMLTDAAATADSQTEKSNAEEKKTSLLENMQKEQDIENAIAAKGLPDCLVLISENGVNVTVNKQELNDTDVAKICDIVMRETGMKASEIIVQSKF